MANKKRVQTVKEEYDVALIGGGVLSATFGLMLHLLEPEWSIVGFERLPKVAKESSNPWNNAGTGHSGGLCELNYSTEHEDGTVTSEKALRVNEQFQISREMWSSFVERGILGDPETFITPTPAHVVREQSLGRGVPAQALGVAEGQPAVCQHGVLRGSGAAREVGADADARARQERVGRRDLRPDRNRCELRFDHPAVLPLSGVPRGGEGADLPGGDQPQAEPRRHLGNHPEEPNAEEGTAG